MLRLEGHGTKPLKVKRGLGFRDKNGETSGPGRFVEGRKPVGNCLQRKTISYRSGLTVLVIGILHLAQARGSHVWRMLFACMLVRLVAICICTVRAPAQNATWLLNPGSGGFTSAANWEPAAVPTGTATFGASNTTTITFSVANTSVGTLQSMLGRRLIALQ